MQPTLEGDNENLWMVPVLMSGLLTSTLHRTDKRGGRLAHVEHSPPPGALCRPRCRCCISFPPSTNRSITPLSGNEAKWVDIAALIASSFTGRTTLLPNTSLQFTVVNAIFHMAINFWLSARRCRCHPFTFNSNFYSFYFFIECFEQRSRWSGFKSNCHFTVVDGIFRMAINFWLSARRCRCHPVTFNWNFYSFYFLSSALNNDPGEAGWNRAANRFVRYGHSTCALQSMNLIFSIRINKK